MNWQVHQDGTILDGDRVVGSMVSDPLDPGKPLTWRVEIMWSGPGGDIVYETEVHAAALAFIIGVEKAVDRLIGPASPRMVFVGKQT